MSSLNQLFVVLSWKLFTKYGFDRAINMKMLKMRFESDQGKTIIAHSLICHSDAHSLKLEKKGQEGVWREKNEYSK